MQHPLPAFSLMSCFFCVSWLPDPTNLVNHRVQSAVWLTRYIYWQTHIFSPYLQTKTKIQKGEEGKTGIFKNFIEKLSFCLGTKMNILELWAKEKGSGLGGTLWIWCHLSGGFHFQAWETSILKKKAGYCI